MTAPQMEQGLPQGPWTPWQGTPPILRVQLCGHGQGSLETGVTSGRAWHCMKEPPTPHTDSLGRRGEVCLAVGSTWHRYLSLEPSQWHGPFPSPGWHHCQHSGLEQCPWMTQVPQSTHSLKGCTHLPILQAEAEAWGGVL